jgi:hypothetical protein
MRAILMTAVAAVALGSLSSAAEARDGCGRGWFYNGSACVQEEGQSYSRQPYYEPPPAYPQSPYYAPEPGYGPPRGRGYGGQTNRGQDCYTVRGQRICCPKGWTVQDGTCKPYSGR